MNTGKKSTKQAVSDTLASKPDATAAEIAATTGLGRSTVGKTLATLARSGAVRRTPGGRDAGRRQPDRWALAADKKRSHPRTAKGRLRPGQLDRLVLDYLRKDAGSGPLSTTAVARGLGRSSGAVGNCLTRLAAAEQVRQVGEHPRRYTTAS